VRAVEKTGEKISLHVNDAERKRPVIREIRKKVRKITRVSAGMRAKKRQSLPKKCQKNRAERAKYFEILLPLADSFFIALY
jgi:hypothetical protein